MSESSPAGHPVSSTSNPQNPAESMTDGVKQLNLNQEEKKEKPQQQQQQQKKERKDKKKDVKPAGGDSAFL